jgi:L-lysine 6-oxidase
MAIQYEIHPSIGIARVGNSPTSFYLAPETIGGRPVECDDDGDVIRVDGAPKPVERYKDDQGRIRRQAARFAVLARDSADPHAPTREVTVADADVEAIEWTVHVANKKAVWYAFSELDGNLMLGEENSYENRNVPVRNRDVIGEHERQKLIIDPGPRSLAGTHQSAAFSRDTIPPDYPHGSFPPPDLKPYPINTLGDVMTDADGRLLVLGGLGHAGGKEPITGFGGADSWYDDVSDGPVNCRLRLRGGQTVELGAWVIVGSPKYSPELVNVVTLDDVMYDVGVRYLSMVPDLYDASRWPDGWNPDYVADFDQDIAPIIYRPGSYIWVANVPSMTVFSPPRFDVRDASEANRPRREGYHRYFRQPGRDGGLGPQEEVLLSDGGVPLMLNNSGSNSVSNQNVDKFLTLTPTQYHLLGQWARGRFTCAPADAGRSAVHPLDRASVGNCVGGPLCPGIEVTWSATNPAIYERPFHLKPRFDEAYYREYGLSTQTYDETASGQGCEPGDMTKRMAIPWQADFFDCSVQQINFTDPLRNKAEDNYGNQIPLPPAYYTYWWPPQSPMFVISGAMSAAEQRASGVNAGYQVYFPRGVNNFYQMISAWSYMGFVVNQNTAADRDAYPYFVEVERNHDEFVMAGVAVGDVTNVTDSEVDVFAPVWYLKRGGAECQTVLRQGRRHRGR